ncbi:MAG: radical SAM protein [Candidatus Scalindua sp. AMX11]|nr:MAG: radical SAM protein [Candidatus Scalindua sp.]NOG82229.1 B12-binding domain-containing radical SAM protein [Planctomycetota bacterium]RZV65511.1 MAG: B12-binding domain-containing radical SAM protein [Candidatus Scalindua sp. SCAELEC01]TDE63391.1 MAG: radical SAM protein [Candidatus Scalindua sp. AMX11]GJQ57251.1 MAG: B12-binding domain-containing radical SAM protein [Candidatus Scalindua sp.]
MTYFKNVCLLKAPQKVDIPYGLIISDITEVCYLAGMVKDDVDTITVPVDTYSHNPLRAFKRYLSRHTADFIGLSAMTGAYSNALEYAKIAKEHGLYVVIGGYHPSALPGEVLNSPLVDAVIRGEGELTFKELINNGPSEDILGLSFKDNGRVIHNPDRALIEDLDTIPHPLREIRPKRFGNAGSDYLFDTVFTSRGCKIKCSFCSNDMVNKSWRCRSPENVIEELKMIHTTKKRKILKIWDANVLTSVDRMEKIVDLMFENDLTNFKIWTESRSTDIIKAERIMKKLHGIGLRHVSLGIESPNLETLKKIQKATSPKTCERAIEILNDYKIKVQGYFIIGHLNETVEDIKRYPEYARMAGLKQAAFMVMTPYPGTKIYEEYKRENAINSYNWDLYNNFGTVVEPNKIDLRTLKKMLAYCNGKFYGIDSSSRQRTISGTILEAIFRLINVAVIETNDDRNSRSDLKDCMFEYLHALVGNEIKDAQFRDANLLRKFGKNIIFRFYHSKGKSVDFKLSMNGSTTDLSINDSKVEADYRCVSLYLDDILNFQEHLPLQRIFSLTSRYDVARANRKKKPMIFLTLAMNRNFLASIYHLSSLLIKTVFRSAFQKRHKQFSIDQNPLEKQSQSSVAR